jgi:hypothetical protein
MRLLLDTSKLSATVTRGPVERVDQNGAPKVDRRTGARLFHVQVMVLDVEAGAEILNVTVDHEPKLTVGQAVSLVELEAIPWSTNGKSGVAYKAVRINPVQATTKAA